MITISPSQLATFQDCPRKWAYDKLDHRPRAESDSAREGSLIHDQVEKWFLLGEPPERPEAKALLTHLPNRDEVLVVEAPIQWVYPGHNVMIHGFADLMRKGRRPKVWDHKTTSAKKYIKTKEQLRFDAQSVCYGMGARIESVWDGQELSGDVDLQWTYVIREQPKTRPPYTEPVELVQTLTDLKEGLEFWSPTVAKIEQAHSLTGENRALKLHPEQESCYKYGGCPHRDVCPDYVGRLPKLESPMNPALLAALANASAAPMSPGTTPYTPPEEQNRPATPPNTEIPKMGLIDTLKVMDGVAPQVIPPDAQPNVSPTDPPPPPLVPTKGKGRAKAKVHAEQPEAAPTPPLFLSDDGDYRVSQVTAIVQAQVVELMRIGENKKAGDLLHVLHTYTQVLS